MAPGSEEGGWFPCPDCDLMVTGLVKEAPEGHHCYSSTHCCKECEAEKTYSVERMNQNKDPWSCAAVPASALRHVYLPGYEAPAHYILHDPGSPDGSPLPAMLFLHGSMTYIYPETLWWDVRDLAKKNPVVAKSFVVIAPFASIGEPIAEPSQWPKANRFGKEVNFVHGFREEATWALFLAALRALGPGRIDPAQLHVTGYSMGGQAAWNLATLWGSRLASVAPIAGACSWNGESWQNQAAHLAELQSLPIWSYAGNVDRKAASWRDFWWLASERGGSSKAVETPKAVQTATASMALHAWSSDLFLGLIEDSGAWSNHCIWETVYHNEEAFGLFTRMLAARCKHPLSQALEAEPAFPASRRVLEQEQAKAMDET